MNKMDKGEKVMDDKEYLCPDCGLILAWYRFQGEAGKGPWKIYCENEDCDFECADTEIEELGLEEIG